MRRKETFKVEPEGNTAELRRRTPVLELVIRYCLKHLNKAGFISILGIMGYGGVQYNSHREVTQDQLGLIWHEIHQIQNRMDASGMNSATNNFIAINP
jgi:hypothetical protein